MKKIFLLMLMGMMLTGCKKVKKGTEDIVDSMNMYKDGIYSAKVNGYGGEFDVSMTYQNDKIVDVSIGQNNETPSIGGVAAEQIAKNVKEQNTIELDTISGATVTSNAIYSGLKDIEHQAKKTK